MNTALQQQRLEVEQLRREAAMKRIPVSQAVEDIKVSKNSGIWVSMISKLVMRMCRFWSMSHFLTASFGQRTILVRELVFLGEIQIRLMNVKMICVSYS